MNYIELAKEANGEPAGPGGVDWTWDELERFAALVEAQEREECIKLVHEGTGYPVQIKTLVILQKERKRIADEIRARGNT